MSIGLFIISCPLSVALAGAGPDAAVLGGLPSTPSVRAGIVRWPGPVDAAAARAFAVSTGGELASIADVEVNRRLTCWRNLPDLALGPCEGPWIGLERPAAALPGGAWRWTDLSEVTFTRWSEGAPSTSVRIMAAAALLDDGRWIDSMVSPESGSEIRSAAILWPTDADGDRDGVPDALATAGLSSIIVDPIACDLDPADLDGDGRVDSSDIAILLASWGTDDAVADINDDSAVNQLDLGELLAAWNGA